MSTRESPTNMLLSRAARNTFLHKAGYNLFSLSSKSIELDLLTDSGTSGLSAAQREKRENADQSYDGSTTSERLRAKLQDVFGFSLIVFTPQGRGAEFIFNTVMIGRERFYVAGNTPFDTTRHNIEAPGGVIADCTGQGTGDVDCDKLEAFLGLNRDETAYILVTITCNNRCGLPVSISNLERVKEIARAHNVPFFIDGARYALNAYLNRKAMLPMMPYGQDSEQLSIPNLVWAETEADGVLISFKKDAMAEGGGAILLSTDYQWLYDQLLPLSIAYFGGRDYGGIPASIREEIIQGLDESLSEPHLEAYVNQVKQVGTALKDMGIPCVAHGHAVFVDAGELLPHLQFDDFPGQSLAIALYLAGGIRSCEVGSLMLGRDPLAGYNRHSPAEMVRLAIPRRRYTDEQLTRVADTFQQLKDADWFAKMPKVTICEPEPPIMRHFTARFAWK